LQRRRRLQHGNLATKSLRCRCLVLLLVVVLVPDKRLVLRVWDREHIVCLIVRRRESASQEQPSNPRDDESREHCGDALLSLANQLVRVKKEKGDSPESLLQATSRR
jgi:hypothetical protein